MFAKRREELQEMEEFFNHYGYTVTAVIQIGRIGFAGVWKDRLLIYTRNGELPYVAIPSQPNRLLPRFAPPRWLIRHKVKKLGIETKASCAYRIRGHEILILPDDDGVLFYSGFASPKVCYIKRQS